MIAHYRIDMERSKITGTASDRCSPRCGDPGEARTHDPVIKSHLLYQLSYRVIKWLVHSLHLAWWVSPHKSSAKVAETFEYAKCSTRLSPNGLPAFRVIEDRIPLHLSSTNTSSEDLLKRRKVSKDFSSFTFQERSLRLRQPSPTLDYSNRAD